MHTHDRRAFLGKLTALSAITSATACARTGVVSNSIRPFTISPEPDAWVQRITRAKHRAVFDSPAIDSGTALGHAFIYMDGYQKRLGVSDDELAVVVVVRHAAMSMVIGSALWQRYGIGAAQKLNDAATGKPVERNPYEFMTEDEVRANEGIASGIANLQQRGVIVLGCDLALSATTRQLARRLKREPAEVAAEVRAGLVAGVIVAPSGIYALCRAQETGCVLVKST